MNALGNLRIGTKLTVILVLNMALLVIMGLVASLSAQRQYRQFQDMAEPGSPTYAQQTKDYTDNLGQAGGFLAGFVGTFLMVRRWQDMEELVGAEGLQRIENVEEEAAVRQASPTLFDSGLRVINTRKRPRRRS